MVLVEVGGQVEEVEVVPEETGPPAEQGVEDGRQTAGPTAEDVRP